MEERFFREHFLREWIVALSPRERDSPGMLLAVDGNQRIAGANRVARTALSLDDPDLQAGVSLWSIFERVAEIFRAREGTDVATQLMKLGDNRSDPALVTPPIRSFSAWRDPTTVALHTRPRLDVIGSLASTTPPPQARGGLAPGVMRRVQEYVEAHLGNNVDLAALASVADYRYIISQENSNSPQALPRTII